jgi:hypothetical protein
MFRQNKDPTMSNDLKIYNSDNDGWQDAAQVAADPVIRGSLLKFASGLWTVGQNALNAATRLLAVGTAVGWVKWWGGRPVKYRMRQPGESLLERENLGDTNPSNWEIGPDSKTPRDPWERTSFVYLLGENGVVYTYSTTSSSGRSAVSELADQILRMRFDKPGAVPVIELHSAPMQTRFGQRSKPCFVVVDWSNPGTELSAARPNGPTKDMRDDVPF